MTWWDNKIALLLFLAVSFFSCEEDIGEINVSRENDFEVIFEEVPLTDKIGQLWAGSTQSSFSGIMLSGLTNDSIFGKVEARAFCDLSVEIAQYDTSTIASGVLNQLSFNLRVIDAKGNFSSGDIQRFDLYQLAEPMENVENFSTATTLPLGEKIGEAQLALMPDSIGLELSGVVDTTKYDANGLYKYLLRFEITEDFKADFFAGFINSVQEGAAKQTDPDDPDAVADIDSVGYFLDQNIKGFAVIPQAENTAIISFGLTNPTNYDITLKYTTTDGSSTTERDANFLFNPLKSFNHITPNEETPWSNSLINNIDERNKLYLPTNDYVYYQEGTNLFITIDMRDFLNLDAGTPNTIIQRAEIVFNNVHRLEPQFNLPSSLFNAISNTEDIAEGILSNGVDNNVLSDLPSAMNYVEEDNAYLLEPTLYLQGIIDGTIPYDHIIVGTSADNRLNSFAIKKSDIILRYYYSINKN